MSTILFEECLRALSPHVKILSRETTKAIFALFEEACPINLEGRIHEKEMRAYERVYDVNQVVSTLQQLLNTSLDPSIYVLWNNAHIPAVQTCLNQALENFDNIACVAPDFWFFNLYQEYVVEFHHTYGFSVGLIKNI